MALMIGNFETLGSKFSHEIRSCEAAGVLLLLLKKSIAFRTLINTRQIEMTFYSSTNHKSQNNGFYDRKLRDPRLEI